MTVEAVTLLVFVVALAGLVWFVSRLTRSLQWGMGALLFFLPFERIPTLDVGGFTLKMNHLIGGLLLLFWIVGVVFHRRQLVPNPLLIPLSLFACALLISTIPAGDSERAWAYVLADLFVLGICLTIPQIVRQRDDLPPLIRIIFLTTWITIFFGIYQFLGDLVGLPITLTGLTPAYAKAVFGFPRVQAFETEPLYLGNYLLMPIGLILAFLAVPQTWLKRSYLVISLIAIGVIFGFTLSRGAFVGLAGVILVISLLFGKRLLTLKNFLLASLGISLAIVGISGILSFLGDNTADRFFRHLTVQDYGQAESTVGRLKSWFEAIELWQESPLIGVGPGNFGEANLGYPSEPPPGGWPIVNNQYFELLAENGVFGLGFFLIFILCLLVRSWRAYWRARADPLVRPVLVGLSAAVVGILLQYNFFSTLYILPVWVTIGLLMAVQTIALRPLKES